MKVHSLTRHSHQRSAQLRAGPLVFSGVLGPRAIARELRSPNHRSLFVDRYSLIAPILSDGAAIRNARNSNTINAKSLSNRQKNMFWRAFRAQPIAGHASQVAASRVAGRRSWITSHCSRIRRVIRPNSRYNHAFLRAAGQSNTWPGCAAGSRQPARHETGFGLRPSNVAALILGTTKDNA
jgi:hypothetical protein